jgi:hypothetical protein
MKALVDSWREAWGVSDQPSRLPVGIVTLAGGTDEGQPYSMANMRYAQTSNQGFLPSPEMPFTFAAQAHDLGDPCSQMGDDGFPSGGDGRCCSNHQAYGNYPCYKGVSPHTSQYMGSLHPRVKQLVGQRYVDGHRCTTAPPCICRARTAFCL